MTKVGAIPLYGKTLKIYFFRTNWPMALELGM